VTCIPIVRQRLGKHISAQAKSLNSRMSVTRKQMSKHASLTIEAVFSLGSVQRGYKEVFRSIEQESNTSTVTLRVVGGDEKGSIKSETVKYGLQTQGNRIRERLRWQGSAAYTKDRPVLPSERVTHKNKAVTVKQ
jgi:hypothetical protein